MQFAGLDTRDSDVSARAFVDRFGVPYPNVIDRDGRLQLLFADSLPPQAIPSTLVIDPEGRVAARALGKVSESSLRGIIEQLASARRRVGGGRLVDGIGDLVTSGALWAALPIAFAAGVVAFLSPCVLPLAPGYVSYITGLTGAELADVKGRRSQVLAGSLLFVLGFSVVFVSYGALFGGAGSLLLEYADVINRVLGVLVILMGLAFMGLIPGLQREWRLHRMPTWGVAGAPVLGLLFGLGWTPCIGPTLDRGADPRLHRGQRAARRPPLVRVLPGPRPAVRAAGPGIQPHGEGHRLGADPLRVGDAHRRRHAGPRGHPPGHRPVDRLHGLAAGPGARIRDGPVSAPVDEAATGLPQDRPLPPLGSVGLLRWMWRQLTSMRTALILLFLLAIASVPGSVLPQRGTNPLRVDQWLDQNPTTGPVLDRLGFFDVYASPWFAAVYLLLFISLIGCVLPRIRQHAKSMRAQPPPAPRRMSRLPMSVEFPVPDDPAATLASAEQFLRGRRWRVRSGSTDAESSGWVAAEKGYLRETGNLVFHLALLFVLLAVAVGGLLGWKGNVIVREG